MAKMARRSAKHHLKGPAKRMPEDDRRFEEIFRRLIKKVFLMDDEQRM